MKLPVRASRMITSPGWKWPSRTVMSSLRSTRRWTMSRPTNGQIIQSARSRNRRSQLGKYQNSKKRQINHAGSPQISIPLSSATAYRRPTDAP